ncbi:MAG: DUF1638 domain-containing protein [Pseudomonadota bacterium]
MSEGQRRRGGRQARIEAVAAKGADLVEKGVPNYTRSSNDARVCVIACGALAREILDVVEANNLSHIALTCLPAKLHNTPEHITGAVERAITDARNAGFTDIFCAYGDCGTGGHLDRLLEREKVERLPGAHCYAFFWGVEDFMADVEIEMRAFFLTDFLARHFDGLTWKTLGLDRHPELVKDYFGHYEKVIYIAQDPSAPMVDRAREIAERLGLDFEQRLTGYGDLETSLKIV